MSFAAQVTRMTSKLLSTSGFGEPAVLVIASGDTPITDLTAVIDEPTEAKATGAPQVPVRERRTQLTLPLPGAEGIQRNSQVTVAVPAGDRVFLVDSVSSRDLDLIVVNVREVPGG